MSSSPPLLSIRITPRSGRRYKSIAELSWNDVPGFAVLTGRNGSGKTQLLEVLAYHLSGALPPNMARGETLPVEVTLTGAQYRPEHRAYVPNTGRFSGTYPISIGTISSGRQQILQLAQQANSQLNDITTASKVRFAASLLAGKSNQNLTEKELTGILGDHFEFMLAGADITVGLTFVFVAYRARYAESLERNTPGLGKDGQALGPAPWDVVNQSLLAAGFPYEVTLPTEVSLFDLYEMKLRDIRTKTETPAIDLSSGEKTLLQLVLWLYATKLNSSVFPKVLLLDEPDAHLHPSMTTQFLNIISDVLVSKYGIRVIITTHSPSTVALAPEGSVFQLDRGAKIVEKITNRQDAIAVLTSGLLTVSRSSKFCFVEDERDADFYGTVRDLLSDSRPSRDPSALKPSPSIAFIPASVGSGADKIPAGQSVVEKWVSKLDAEPLNRTFVGLIDRDVDNRSRDRIYVIGRYSIENYLLDPLNLFCLLLEEGTQPHVLGLEVSAGDEHLLRMQSADLLQAASDAITNAIEGARPNIRTEERVAVIYTIGCQINVPSWVANHRGHDLLPIAQGAFGGHRLVNPPRLIKALRRGRLIPSELASLLARIQSD